MSAERTALENVRRRSFFFQKGPIAVSLLLLLLLAGCSSLPKGNGGVNTVKNQAAQYAAQGNTHYEQGDYVQAERYFRMALDADFSVDNRYGVASSYNSLARVYLAAGDNAAARSAFDNAAQHAIPATTPAYQTLIVAIRTGQAELLLVEGKPTAALALLQKAQAAPAPADTVEQANLLHDIGAAHKELGDYPEALVFLNKALDLHNKLGKSALEASDLYMIASVYSKQQDYARAERYANLALEKDKLVENSVGIGSDLRALGIIRERLGQQSQAYESYYSALQVFRTLNMPAEVKDLLGRLEKTATALGKTKEAALYADALKKLEAGK